MSNLLFGSVCRIADFNDESATVQPLPADRWSTGDYVVGTVANRPSHRSRLEAPSGRTIEPLEGEQIVGAFGRRHATRGIVGDWRTIDSDNEKMAVIGGGGVIGAVTSQSPFKPDPIPLRYDGHVHVNGTPASMMDYVPSVDSQEMTRPVVLVMGTSMSSGKTMSARVLVRALIEMGRSPIACKLAGSGRYHDVQTMRDAGANTIFDFVDAGLPTTVVPEETYRNALENLTGRIEEAQGDIVVVEVGASPLEPYNGNVAIDYLKENVVFSLLTASDPYSVVGFQSEIDLPVDVVSGIATNTDAGIELIETLTGCPALNLQLEETMDPLIKLLQANVSDQ